eukprot:2388472-Pyramimonas_sp.AAC.1
MGASWLFPGQTSLVALSLLNKPSGGYRPIGLGLQFPPPLGAVPQAMRGPVGKQVSAQLFRWAPVFFRC